MDTLNLDSKYSVVPSDDVIQKTAQALEANGFHTVIAENEDEAKAAVLELIPKGAEVFTSTSQTLLGLGLDKEINESGDYASVRNVLNAMGNNSAMSREKRQLGAAPDYVVGSIHALTEDGHAIIASMSGSQLPAYVNGAEKVIWVVGAQKITADVPAGIKRIYEYSLPLEDQRAQKAYGTHSEVRKMAVVNKERTGRVSIVLIKENIGY